MKKQKKKPNKYIDIADLLPRELENLYIDYVNKYYSIVRLAKKYQLDVILLGDYIALNELDEKRKLHIKATESKIFKAASIKRIKNLICSVVNESLQKKLQALILDSDDTIIMSGDELLKLIAAYEKLSHQTVEEQTNSTQNYRKPVDIPVKLQDNLQKIGDSLAFGGYRSAGFLDSRKDLIDG